MLHGQRYCFLRNPACGRCVLLDLSPEGRLRLRNIELDLYRGAGVQEQPGGRSWWVLVKYRRLLTSNYSDPDLP